MSEALRDTHGKLDWSMLFEYFPLAMPELCRAREFGARHYTKDGKDGRSNWRDSINTERHEAFMKDCVRGNLSHDFKFLWGEKRDAPQDNVHHLAFSALNALMALEYSLAEAEAVQPKTANPCPHDSITETSAVGYINETKTRYPWHEAPEWAMWGATDANGNMNWYDFEPSYDNDDYQWLISYGEHKFFANEGPCENWEQTLEVRPK